MGTRSSSSSRRTHTLSNMAEKIQGLVGAEVINKQGEKVAVASLCGEGKVVALYCSAHWCPPCRAFTPQLAEFYKKFKAGPKADQMDVIFLSCDRDEESFKDYYNSMPWLALAFEDQDKARSCMSTFSIRGIPALVLLDGATGDVINPNARMDVVNDLEGQTSPGRSNSVTQEECLA